MRTFFIGSIIVLFVCLLFLNIYFKSNILKTYKFLSGNNVRLTMGQMLNRPKLQTALAKYPNHADTIKSLASKLKFAIVSALTIIIVIGMLGLSLLFI